MQACRDRLLHYAFTAVGFSKKKNCISTQSMLKRCVYTQFYYIYGSLHSHIHFHFVLYNWVLRKKNIEWKLSIYGEINEIELSAYFID